ncbi:MAG: hypothetical protein AAFV88_22620 [Planctomycetota bacterium]
MSSPLCFAAGGEKIAGDDPTHANPSGVISDQQARATVASLLDWGLEKMPREFRGDKHWGDTKKVWSGVRFRRDGLRLKTNRRWRELRHGRPVKYRVAFPASESAKPPVQVDLRAVTFQPATAEASAGWKIECECASPLDFSARIERWNFGVQWYSVEVKGHLSLRMRVTGRLSVQADYSEIPPAIVIDPSVESSTLTLEELHVDRISKIGGEVAEQWGDLVHQIADELLKDNLNEKITEKLNRGIDKNRDRLRYSAHDLFELASKKIPAPR